MSETKAIIPAFHVFHSWTKWQVTHSGEIKKDRGGVVGHTIMQERECTVCGLKQLKSDQEWLV